MAASMKRASCRSRRLLTQSRHLRARKLVVKIGRPWPCRFCRDICALTIRRFPTTSSCGANSIPWRRRQILRVDGARFPVGFSGPRKCRCGCPITFSKAQVVANAPGCDLAEFTVGDARAQKCIVVRDPADPSHGLIYDGARPGDRSITSGAAKRIRDRARHLTSPSY